MKIAVSIRVVTHEAVERVAGADTNLIQIGALEVSIECNLRAGARIVQRHLVPLGIRDGGWLASIDGGFQICGGSEGTGTFLEGSRTGR